MTIGHRTALISAITTATSSAASNESVSTPGRIAGEGASEHHGLDSQQQDTRSDHEPEQPAGTRHAYRDDCARRSLEHLVARFSGHGPRRGYGPSRGHLPGPYRFPGPCHRPDRAGRRASAHRPAAASVASRTCAGRSRRSTASVTARPRRRADLAPAPRSPRPRLAAAIGSRYARCWYRRAPAHGCAGDGFTRCDRAQRRRHGRAWAR